MTRPLTLSALVVLMLAAFACGDDSASNNATTNNKTSMSSDMSSGMDMSTCGKNLRFDETLGKCIPDFKTDMNTNVPEEDMFMPDMSMPDMAMEKDLAGGPCVNTTLYKDKDKDGEGVDDPLTNITECVKQGEIIDGYARQAGDCDDDDVRRGLTAKELCDDVDNDCDDENNEGLQCAFLAHTGDEIYLVDPFKKTIELQGNIPGEEGAFLDIDTDPSTGNAYGVTSQYLYKNSGFGWSRVGDKFGQNLVGANGMAIDRGSKAYVTKDDKIFEINLETGKIVNTSTVQKYTVGQSSRTVNSSGDCVINKGDTFYVSSKNSSRDTDDLVFVDISNGTTRLVGETAHKNIYGLTAAWGELYGVTSNGEIIKIDEGTGQSTLVFKADGKVWFGAASTPRR